MYPKPKQKQPIPENAQLVFKGKVFDVYQWQQELYNGKKVTFEKLKRADTVVVFPVLPDGQILVAEQEQPGVPPFISGLGGRVEENEDILLAAKRELLEESGYEAEEFILWDAQQPYTKMDWNVYTFIAKNVKKVSEVELDGGEKIHLKSVTLDEFIDLGLSKSFSEKEIIPLLVEAKIYPDKKEELIKLFFVD